MSSFWVNRDSTEVSIKSTEETNGITMYVIQIKVGTVMWTVKRRYNDFYELHQGLVTDHGVSKDILPPKKFFSKCPIFIESRRKGLESYLKTVFNYLQRTMPRLFSKFLHFNHYDNFFVVQSLAAHFYREGQTILQTDKTYSFSPLELHALCEYIRKPFPIEYELNKRHDVCNVLDICAHLEHLKVHKLPSPYKNSNIEPNSLPFGFKIFPSLKSLEVNELSLKYVTNLGNLRTTLNKISVTHSWLKSISEVLLCDTLYHEQTTESQVWHCVTELDLTANKITNIDATIKLVPNLKTLILSQNTLVEIKNLSSLSKLSHLVLSNNCLAICDQLHMKLGNIIHLDLSQNSITSLCGFEKLYSLESLDVSCNKIVDLNEIRFIGKLPCLEHVRLTGNPIAVTVDYRVNVFVHFDSRAPQIHLDNEKGSQKELDTVCILGALKIAKESKNLHLLKPNF